MKQSDEGREEVEGEKCVDSNQNIPENYYISEYQSNNVQKYNEIFVFGSNKYGQIGLSEKNSGKNFCIPRFCHFNIVFMSVSCGAHHSVFLTQDGYVYTVGSNIYGQLGLQQPNLNYSFTPSLVQTLQDRNIIKITSGAYHTMALTSENQLFSWGRNHDGQLGLGSTASHIVDPHIVQTHEEVRNVFCGWNHSFFISSKNEVYSFGSGLYGQLGQGKCESESFPCRVLLNEQEQRIVKIAVGETHTLFLNDRGEILGCGENQSGQVGLGKSKKVVIFPQILSNQSYFGSEKIAEIACGRFSVAVTEKSLSVFAWGQISREDANPIYIPKLINSEKMKSPDDILKNGIQKVEVGYDSCILMTKKGDLYSWGKNSFGECGLADFEDKLDAFYPINFLKGKQILTFHMGQSHTVVLGSEVFQKSSSSLTEQSSLATLVDKDNQNFQNEIQMNDISGRNNVENNSYHTLEKRVETYSSLDHQQLHDDQKSGQFEPSQEPIHKQINNYSSHHYQQQQQQQHQNSLKNSLTLFGQSQTPLDDTDMRQGLSKDHSLEVECHEIEKTLSLLRDREAPFSTIYTQHNRQSTSGSINNQSMTQNGFEINTFEENSIEFKGPGETGQITQNSQEKLNLGQNIPFFDKNSLSLRMEKFILSKNNFVVIASEKASQVADSLSWNTSQYQDLNSTSNTRNIPDYLTSHRDMHQLSDSISLVRNCNLPLEANKYLPHSLTSVSTTKYSLPPSESSNNKSSIRSRSDSVNSNKNPRSPKDSLNQDNKVLHCGDSALSSQISGENFPHFAYQDSQKIFNQDSSNSDKLKLSFSRLETTQEDRRYPQQMNELQSSCVTTLNPTPFQFSQANDYATFSKDNEDNIHLSFGNRPQYPKNIFSVTSQITSNSLDLPQTQSNDVNSDMPLQIKAFHSMESGSSQLKNNNLSCQDRVDQVEIAKTSNQDTSNSEVTEVYFCQENSSPLSYDRLNGKINQMNDAFHGLILKLSMENNETNDILQQNADASDLMNKNLLQRSVSLSSERSNSDTKIENEKFQYFTCNQSPFPKSEQSPIKPVNSVYSNFGEESNSFKKIDPQILEDEAFVEENHQHIPLIQDKKDNLCQMHKQASSKKRGVGSNGLKRSHFELFHDSHEQEHLIAQQKKEIIDQEVKRQQIQLQNILQEQNTQIEVSIQKFKEEYFESQNNMILRQKIEKLEQIISGTSSQTLSLEKNSKNVKDQENTKPLSINSKSQTLQNNNLSQQPTLINNCNQNISSFYKQIQYLSVQLSSRDRDISELQLALANKEIQIQSLELKNNIKTLQCDTMTSTLDKALSIIDNFQLFSNNFAKLR